MGCNTYIKRLGVVDSTNRYARELASELWAAAANQRAVAVTAEYQTAGRGQRGNSWTSHNGCNLLMSILVRPGAALCVANQFMLSQAVSLAMHRAMKECGIDVRLKWPNDIYVGDRKLAGILVELDCMGMYVEQAVIGIGLNVNQMDFPAMDRVPVSMKMLIGEDVSIDDVLTLVLDSFEYYYDMLINGNGKQLASEYASLLLGLGEVRRFIDSNGEFMAVIVGVEPTGELILRRGNGLMSRYMFKEVEQPMTGI